MDKKDGRVVKPHDRKTPGSTTDSHSPPSPPVPAPEQAAQTQPMPEQSPPTSVFVIGGSPATGLYHRVLCPWLNVKGAMLTTYTIEEAQKRYFQPHCLCIAGHEGVPPCKAAALGSASTATAAPLLAEAPPPSPQSAATTAPAGKAAAQATLASETVYVTKTGDKYHRAGCRFLSKSAIPTALRDASNRYSPCSVCKPPLLIR